MLATFISAGRFPSSSNDIPPPSLFSSVFSRSKLYKSLFPYFTLRKILTKINPYLFIKQACNMFSYFKKTCILLLFYCYGVLCTIVFLSLSFTQVISNFLLSFSLPFVRPHVIKHISMKPWFFPCCCSAAVLLLMMMMVITTISSYCFGLFNTGRFPLVLRWWWWCYSLFACECVNEKRKKTTWYSAWWCIVHASFINVKKCTKFIAKPCDYWPYKTFFLLIIL